MPSGRNSKALRALAKSEVTNDNNQLDPVVSTARRTFIGTDPLTGEERFITTASLAYQEGSFRRVLKQVKKEFKAGNIKFSIA